MNIIAALSTLQSNGVATVTHSQGEVWSIDNLKDSINDAINDGRLEDTSDAGEWVVDGDGIEQLRDGYRTGNRYIAAQLSV